MNIMNLLKGLIPLLIYLLIIISCFGQEIKHQQIYHASKGDIIGSNVGRYNNFPLYINNTNAFILTGDQPIARFAKDQYIYGTFMLSIERDRKSKWLQNCDQIISKFGPGHTTWKVTDKAFPGLKITLEVSSLATSTGMTICASVEGVKEGDKLIWTFGGAQFLKGSNLSWDLDVMGKPKLLNWGFVPEESKNNQVKTDGTVCYTAFHDTISNTELFTVVGKCSSIEQTAIGDAFFWNDPIKFTHSHAKQYPILNGTIILKKGKAVYWAFEAFNLPSTSMHSFDINPKTAFAEGLKRSESFQNRLKISTPDSCLNAVAMASVAAIDGAWYPPVFHHGAMLWNVRLPGWRTIFGGTMYGWHNRVNEEARFYIESQVIKSDKKKAKADPALLLTGQHPDSRFYGVGRIMKDQQFYNMQTQFFDQLVEEYRWTNDPELVKSLRQSLELHLIWEQDCFDPDGDGVYESYINSWPTDSQWYNGGGTAEETSYAYRGHMAARDMARNAGDKEAENYHSQMLEKIKRGFFKKLWINDKGYAGAYREQGGHGRLHQNPWLYSIFLPVDAGLTSQFQAIQSVYYSEWALQNDKEASGGRRVWTSNWVPGIWSVRAMWPGDNYHLALSYFKAGLPKDGWDIMRGTFMNSAFDDIVPGNLSNASGGTNFGDCTHTFSRTLVEGLFGFNPDYPNGIVRISPQFPSEWENASIEIPDGKVAFEKKGDKINYTIKLMHPAKLELQFPVHCKGIRKVSVNGESVKWKLNSGVGQSILCLKLSKVSKAEVTIETIKPTKYFVPEKIEGDVNTSIRLEVKDALIIGVEDPQNVLRKVNFQNHVIVANLTGNKGDHTVIVEVMKGKLPQWRIFRIKLNDPLGDAKEEARYTNNIPANANWQSIDIENRFNADITTIYQQKYLTPRPNTVSLRLGTDGYSPWTFPYWKSAPPKINTEMVKSMLNQKNQLITSQGVPFIWSKGSSNISFTSMWDNYPVKTEFLVNGTGKAIYFLVAGSTNIMQCQIANAVIRLNYADGKTDSLELIPPVNYWNLSTINSHATSPGQESRTDYTAQTDKFCMPSKLPETVRLGKDCRAMLLNLNLIEGVELKSVTLETLSQEVVVGMLGITLLK